MKGRTDVRTYVVRTYVVRTDVDDVIAIKPNFLTSMGYHIFLTMVLRARSSPKIATNEPVSKMHLNSAYSNYNLPLKTKSNFLYGIILQIISNS